MKRRAEGLVATVDDRHAAWLPRIDDPVRVVIRHGRTCQECPHFDGESGRTGRVVNVRAPLGASERAPYLRLVVG